MSYEMNPNSLEVYNKIKASGALSAMRLEALSIFYILNRPCTAEEAHRLYNTVFQKEPNQNLFNSYVTQLKKQCGALEVIDQVKNSKGNTVDLFRVTGEAHKPKKSKPKSERLAEIKVMLKNVAKKCPERGIKPDLQEIWVKILAL